MRLLTAPLTESPVASWVRQVFPFRETLLPPGRPIWQLHASTACAAEAPLPTCESRPCQRP